MAKSEMKSEISKASLPTEAVERFKLSEIGVHGSYIFNGVSNQELKQELNHPNAIKTYKLMSYHPACNAALSLYSAMIAKSQFRVVPPKNATAKEKKQAEIVSQMLFEDMETNFEDFVQDALTMSTYGFSVVEKVYRRRNKSSGSIFNDDLIAPKKLSLRHQQSIEKFLFTDDGVDIKGVRQVVSNSNDALGRYLNKTEINIPRSKFMLFTAGQGTDNPFGVSPLRNVYLPWKYLSALEEIEAVGINKDLSGIPVLRLPAGYMSSDATPEQKAIYESFKQIVRNLQAGSQSGLILPSAMDTESRSKLFDIELLSVDGKRGFDIDKVKQYYRAMIFIGLQADILLMGSATTSSFAMGSVKNSLTANQVRIYLKRICNVINNDLIKQIYELNDWKLDRRCKIDAEGFEDESLDEIGKFLQRVLSVNGLNRDIDTVNFARNALGLDLLPADTNMDDLIFDGTSRAGDAIGSPFEGTRTSNGDGANSSDLNSNNAA